MKIKYQNIILRDMIQQDIEDWIRWDSTETEWMNWDAPDEPIEEINPEEYRKELLDFVNKPRPDGFRNFFEIATDEGLHIGRINSYAINETYEWVSWPESVPDSNFRVAIGIDICDSRVWGKGYGSHAISAFIQHFLEYGIRDICLQTWSGNYRMIHVAEKLEFEECNRHVGNRLIHGEVYDSVTLRLELEKFNDYLNRSAEEMLRI